MTVSYQYEVASSTSGGFTRLLFMWRGSLYKLIYRELMLFLALFAAISAIYRYVLTKPHKRKFEQIVVWCDTFISLIPLSFVLGFYVAYVAARWWQQYMAIPWPDKVMHLVALYVTGNDEYGRMLRRALMRYLNLSLILVLRSISSAVKRRFPTLEHVVDYGFMTSLELELFQSVPSLEFNTYWIPCTWFINLLKEARRSHRLPDAQGLKIIMEEFNDFRSKCGLLWSYDWVSIPLVYTQVVTLATYSFFVVALLGRQYIEGAKKPFQMEVDAYLPIFTILQFFFYMGLLKVAEQLINPFGDDDEDFELNWLIDRHTKVSYLGVDTLMNRCPPLVKDIFYDAENVTLPYTEAAAAYKRKTYRGSVANMTVPEEKQTMFLPDITEEEEDSKGSMTPRTSAVGAANSHESPLDARRQISGSPSTAPEIPRNVNETIVQLDIKEINDEIEQADRRAITEAMRKTPSGRSPRCSTPRIDQNRKPFFTAPKSPRVSLQPWPSATNLSRLAANQHQQATWPDVATTSFMRREKDPTDSMIMTTRRKNSSTSVVCAPFISVSRHESSSSEEEDDEEKKEETDRRNEKMEEMERYNLGGFVNSAFSQDCSVETASGLSYSCQCDDPHSHDPQDHSDLCQFECHHREICQHEEYDDDSHFAVVEKSRRRFNSYPKLVMTRRQSTGCRKKGVRWKRGGDNNNGRESVIRRRTVDCLSSVKKIMPQTISSPNLKDWQVLAPINVIASTGILPTNVEPSERKNDDDNDKEASCSYRF